MNSHFEVMMILTTIGTRFQVVIPLKIRRGLGLKPKQKMQVWAENDRIILEPVKKQKIRGVLRELREKYDATDYIRKLRSEWEKRS